MTALHHLAFERFLLLPALLVHTWHLLQSELLKFLAEHPGWLESGHMCHHVSLAALQRKPSCFRLPLSQVVV